MGEPSPNTIEQAQRLYEAINNRRTRLTTQVEEVVQALKRGESQLLVELPWGEVRNGETHDRHQLILTRLEAGRVFFINALHTNAPAGATIEGQGKGPQRRIEPMGEESMAVDRFRAVFERGGKAMLKDKGQP
jgi:hypothetical protein